MSKLALPLFLPFAAALLVANPCSAKTDAPALEIVPPKLTLRLGEEHALRAKLGGKDVAVRWSVPDAASGSVSSSGVYHAPDSATTPATIHVTGWVDAYVKAECLVFLEPVAVAVAPPAVALTAGQTTQLRAAVEGTADQRVRWSVDGGAARGEVSASGLYSAPARMLTPSSVTVRATSAADPSKSGTAVIRFGAVSIKISGDDEVTLQHGQTHRFVAKVTGSANTDVEWKVLGEGQGQVSPNGLYATPPQMVTPTVISLVASAAADPTKSVVARIRIAAIDVRPAAPGKKRAKGNGLMAQAGKALNSAVQRVTRLYLPFNPVDMIVSGPFFKGKSGKQYVPLGGSVSLSAVVANSTNDRVVWKLEGAKLGEVSPEGIYQAPSTLTTPQVVQVRATSVADPSKSLDFSLHIPPVLVQTQHAAYLCPLGGAVQLAAAVENAEDNRLAWTVEGGDKFGTVSEAGLYHPASVITTPATVRVRATSLADATKFAVLEVAIPEVSLDVSPDDAMVRPGESVRFRTRVKGCPGLQEVTWKLTPEVGTISADGVYRAPEGTGAQVVQVRACLKADPDKAVTATIRIRGR